MEQILRLSVVFARWWWWGSRAVLGGPPKQISPDSFIRHLLSACSHQRKMPSKWATVQGLCLLRDASVVKQNEQNNTPRVAVCEASIVAQNNRLEQLRPYCEKK